MCVYLDSRRHACVSAVENAQQKAFDVSQLLGQTLGPPLLVREEETREWRNEDEEDGGRCQGTAPLPNRPCAPTITVKSRVSVSFSLRDRSRKKLWRHFPLTHKTKVDCHSLKNFIASLWWLNKSAVFQGLFYLSQHKTTWKKTVIY